MTKATISVAITHDHRIRGPMCAYTYTHRGQEVAIQPAPRPVSTSWSVLTMLNLKKLEEEGLGLLLLDTDVDEGAHGRIAAAIPGWLREVLYSFSQFGDSLEWM